MEVVAVVREDLAAREQTEPDAEREVDARLEVRGAYQVRRRRSGGHEVGGARQHLLERRLRALRQPESVVDEVQVVVAQARRQQVIDQLLRRDPDALLERQVSVVILNN